MTDLIFVALVGFAIGVMVQEFHFRRLTRQLEEMSTRIDEELDMGGGDDERPL